MLDGVDLDVAEHQVVVLIGASGSGKSTLLRCIDLLEEIDDGQILLDGRDISDPRIDADEARQAMGMVFQSFNLFPHMTALANVALAPRVVHGSTRRDAQERGRELLARVGLSDKADAYPDKLSGGQQQRVAIARALAYEPQAVAARRDHQRAGPRTGRRGAGPRRRAGDLRPHHRDGHPRNGFRPRRRRHGVLPRRRPNRRIGLGQAGFDRSAARTDPPVPESPDRRTLMPTNGQFFSRVFGHYRSPMPSRKT